MEWNEPLYAEASGPDAGTGVVVLHGFTGSPRSMHELGQRLVGAGYTVALPLLTGHGRTLDAMEASRWEEWAADAEQAHQWARQRADKVFVCGMSMGGALALRLAEHHPDAAGLITINAFIRHPLEMVMLLFARFGIPRTVGAIANDTRAEGVDEKAYSRVPLRSTHELALLSRDVRKNLGKVVCPALLFSSTVDHVVPPANQREILAGIGSADKTLIELDDCYHVATMDLGKERIFSRVLEFIAAH